MDAFVIDAFEFCRLKDQREGIFAVADLPRLAVESVGNAGSLHWVVRGGSHVRGYPQLTLSIRGEVRLMCQRCLTPFDFNLESEAILVLAQDEAAADELDELLADDEVEVVVGSKAFDIRQIVEDDALLALPLSPKHDVCTSQVAQPPGAEREVNPSPFAVLKNLKN